MEQLRAGAMIAAFSASQDHIKRLLCHVIVLLKVVLVMIIKKISTILPVYNYS
jgi:hypothetical protein